MSREPVTIADQTFIYDDEKGWIDKKSKRPADDSLKKLLDSISGPTTKQDLKKVKSKIDSTIEPVTVGGGTYIYYIGDGWINKKSRQKAPPHLQEILNNAVGIDPAKHDEQALKAVTKATGMAGESAKEKVKKPAKEQKVVQNKKKKAKTKTPLGMTPSEYDDAFPADSKDPSAMSDLFRVLVEKVASISWLLKDQFEFNKAKKKRKQKGKKKSTGVKSGTFMDSDDSSAISPVMVAGAIGAIALAFEPVRETLASWIESVKSIASIMTDAFDSSKNTFDNIVRYTEWMDGIPTVLKDIDGGNIFNIKREKDFTKSEKEDRDYRLAIEDEYSRMRNNWRNGWGVLAGARSEEEIAADMREAERRVRERAKNAAPPKKEDDAWYNVFSLNDEEPARIKIPERPIYYNEGNESEVTPKPKEKEKSGVMRKPVEGTITSNYGMRTHPIKGGRRQHQGIDIAAAKGTPISSVLPGKVIFAGEQRGYGNIVYVDHGNGTVTRYAHMSAISVKKGQAVSKGTKLGEVGSTGNSTGNHLHFEVRVNGKSVDPRPYLEGQKPVDTSGASQISDPEESTDTDLRKNPVGAFQVITREMIETIIKGIKDVGTFDTEYKPFNAPKKSQRLQAESVGKKADEIEVKAKIMQTNNTTVVSSRPNLNKGGGAVQVPAVTNDRKVVNQYLQYFDVLK